MQHAPGRLPAADDLQRRVRRRGDDASQPPEAAAAQPDQEPTVRRARRWGETQAKAQAVKAVRAVDPHDRRMRRDRGPDLPGRNLGFDLPSLDVHPAPPVLGLLLGAEIARLVAGSAPRQPPHRGGLAAWQLKRIDDHLHAGHWDCTVTELASLCGLSASHTMRAFRQSVGRTLAAHIAEQRIARACDLLADGALSIAEIAQAVRFGGPSSFSAAFRRSMGTSPGRYRQRRRSS